MKKLILPILLSMFTLTQCSLEDRCARMSGNITEIKQAIKDGTLDAKAFCSRRCIKRCDKY